jgi:hypothetical protein
MNYGQMSSNAAKRALIEQLTKELEEDENIAEGQIDEMTQGILDDIANGPCRRRKGRIDADSVKHRQKYGAFVIPEWCLKEVANALGVDEVYQFHYEDPGADYCGDGSYTYLELGMPVKDKIARVEAELAALKKRAK